MCSGHFHVGSQCLVSLNQNCSGFGAKESAFRDSHGGEDIVVWGP